MMCNKISYAFLIIIYTHVKACFILIIQIIHLTNYHSHMMKFMQNNILDIVIYYHACRTMCMQLNFCREIWCEIRFDFNHHGYLFHLLAFVFLFFVLSSSSSSNFTPNCFFNFTNLNFKLLFSLRKFPLSFCNNLHKSDNLSFCLM
jgi:hypothetical protein